jgi:hypothetical protein
MARVCVLGEGVGQLRRNLLVESLWIGSGSVCWLLSGGLDVLHGDGLLGPGLVHGNRVWSVLLKRRLLRKWVCLRLRQLADRRFRCPLRNIRLGRNRHSNWWLSHRRKADDRAGGVDRERRA